MSYKQKRKELIVKIMMLGSEIDKTQDRMKIVMAINDAEKAVDNFIEEWCNKYFNNEKS